MSHLCLSFDFCLFVCFNMYIGCFARFSARILDFFLGFFCCKPFHLLTRQWEISSGITLSFKKLASIRHVCMRMQREITIIYFLCHLSFVCLLKAITDVPTHLLMLFFFLRVYPKLFSVKSFCFLCHKVPVFATVHATIISIHVGSKSHAKTIPLSFSNSSEDKLC